MALRQVGRSPHVLADTLRLVACEPYAAYYNFGVHSPRTHSEAVAARYGPGACCGERSDIRLSSSGCQDLVLVEREPRRSGALTARRRRPQTEHLQAHSLRAVPCTPFDCVFACTMCTCARLMTDTTPFGIIRFTVSKPRGPHVTYVTARDLDRRAVSSPCFLRVTRLYLKA